jgi:transcription elongation factor Elf1
MAKKMPTKTGDKFPCPVCAHPLDVRITKKNKPYITCDPCGVQLFIRGPTGIAEFERLVERGNRIRLSERLAEMERRYRLTCEECGNKFWAEPELVKTSAFDGSLKGFRCPQRDCKAIVPWEKKR